MPAGSCVRMPAPAAPRSWCWPPPMGAASSARPRRQAPTCSWPSRSARSTLLRLVDQLGEQPHAW